MARLHHHAAGDRTGRANALIELAEVITEAWATKAPKKLVKEFFGE